MRLGVTGATGRMGRTVIEAAAARGETVAFAVNRDPDGATVRDLEVQPSADIEHLMHTTDPAAVVDFTGPAASVAYAQAAAASGVPIVIGTTGFDEQQLTALEDAGEETPVLLGANFARGVQALVDAVESVIETLPEYDVEVTETHHNGKRDAPSGTAGLLLDQIDAARHEPGDRVHGRVGDAPRNAGEVGVHARRAGDITGEHQVLLAGNREALELTHRAGSRRVFAEGALDAAAWLADQPAGFYRFADVADRLT